MLFREKAAELKPPAKLIRFHPLACSGKNETIMTELKDVLFDPNGTTRLGRTTIAGSRLWGVMSSHLRRCLSFNTTSSFTPTVFKASGSSNLRSHSGISSGPTSVVSVKLAEIYCSAGPFNTWTWRCQNLPACPISLQKSRLLFCDGAYVSHP